MLNHIYGVAGLVGLVITIATSFIKNDDISRWILIVSGWLACLIIAMATAWGTRRLTKHLIERQSIHERALLEISELKNKVDELQIECSRAQAISAFLARSDYGKSAKPRASRTKTSEPPRREEEI